jgi:hypothetical protein
MAHEVRMADTRSRLEASTRLPRAHWQRGKSAAARGSGDDGGTLTSGDEPERDTAPEDVCEPEGMTAPGRLPCVVPFCRRTTARADFERRICGDHWRLIDEARRRVYGRHLRRWRRYAAAAYGPTAARIWRVMVGQVIQRAGGYDD